MESTNDIIKAVFTIIFVGIDIGSTTSKCVIINREKEILSYQLIFTEFDRNASGEKVLRNALQDSGQKENEIKFIVTTGYGRKAYARADKDIPEIIAHAVGTVHRVPEVRTIIDIGGQDSKIIEVDENGIVSRFEMNDKCAAGTGRFFEVLSQRLLDVKMEELSPMILRATNPATISSMCTIFAESEIISYLSEGVPMEDIVAGMGQSIVRRIVTMGKSGQIKFKEPIVFSGGVAKNEGIRKEFSRVLGKNVIALDMPQSTAALGAALTALKIYSEEKKNGV